MNLKQKLALRSTLVCAVTLLLVFGGAFYFYKQSIIQQYFSRLDERALTAAFIFLEKDEISIQHYKVYEEKYLQALEEEEVQVYNLDDELSFVPKIPQFYVTKDILATIRKQGKVNYTHGLRQFSGIFYTDNQGDFVILVSGVNLRGANQLQKLFYLLISFFFGGILINYLFNLLVASKTFRPFASVLRQVGTISSDNIHNRIPLNNNKDELADLVKTLNMFLDRLETEMLHQKSFLRRISHELKTPLTVIRSQAELAINNSNEEKTIVLQRIIQDTESIKSIIEGLTMISGLHAGQASSSIVKFRLDELIWDVLEKISFKYPNAVIDTYLEVDATDLELLEISNYKELCYTALSNIIDNALKYSDNETASITVTVDTESPIILVKNTGFPIAQDEVDYVFDLFYRGNSVKHIPGQGIGLSLTKEISDFCNATINISTAETTTCVSVKLHSIFK